MAKPARATRFCGAAGILILATISWLGGPFAYAADGRTSGRFDVSSSGAATYTIPIFVPPGPRGVQPNVALVYSSSAGTGFVGRGWQLSYGGSAISRCNRTVAQDGQTTGARQFLAAIGYSYPQDAFCIDGNRMRLQSGSPGVAGSTYATELADFSRITAVGTLDNGPSSWKVERKDGLTYTYGGSSNSRTALSGLDPSGWSVSSVSTWRLDQIEDRNGNRVLISYENPDGTTTGTTHPTEIKWTQTGHGSGVYLYSIAFNYGSGSNSLPTSPTGFIADNTARDTDLLTSISVKTSGVVKRHYVLEYETSPTTQGKRLTQVTECNDATPSDCLSPTDIVYQNGQAGVVSSPSHALTGGPVADVIGSYDFNGDGFKDLVYNRASSWYVRLASASGYGSEVSVGFTGPLIAGDPFGGGRDVMFGFNGTYTWHAYIWNGSGFSTTNTGISSYDSAPTIALVDVDGDGREDMVYGKLDPGAMIKIGTRPSTSTGSTLSFGSEVVTDHYPPPPAEGGYLVDATANVRLSDGDLWRLDDLDTNGDGRKDILVDGYALFCWDDPYYDCWTYEFGSVMRTTDAYEYEFGYLEYAIPDNLYRAYPASLNSDACTDLVKRWGTSVRVSGCIGGFAATSTHGSVRGVIDWDGDGRQDVLIDYNWNPTLYVQRSTGEGFTSPVDTGISTSCQVFITDANGDGLEDLGCRYLSSIEVYQHNSPAEKPDLATKFTDGFGLEYEVTYAVSTLEGYSPGSSATYPQQDVRSPQVLVRTVEAPDGRGGVYTNTYGYFGATRNMQGRGFEGFDSIEVVDSRAGVKNVRKFAKDYPYTGMMIEESYYQSTSGPLMSKQVRTPGMHVLDSTTHNQRHFPHVSTVTDDAYEVGGVKDGNWITRTAVANTISVWGNLTQSTRVVTDKDSSSSLFGQEWTETTSVTVSPNDTYWCLGLPTASSVTYSSTVSGEGSVTIAKTYSPDYGKCRHNSESVGSGNRQVDTTYGYDDFGNVESVAVTGYDENGNPMTARTVGIDWGSAGGTVGGTGQFPVRERNALIQQTLRTFDPTFGSLLTETDPNGIIVVDSSYDEFGRLERSEFADGTATDIEYRACTGSGTYACENGDPFSGIGTNRMIVVTTERDTGNGMIRDDWRYLDLFDRPVVEKSRTASGSYSRVGSEYDIHGRLARQSAPCIAGACSYHWITNEYDLIGRLTEQSRPFSDSLSTPLVTTTLSYEGRTHKVTDAEGKLTTKILDVNGWIRQSRDDDNYQQNFSYDAAGSLKQVADSASNALFAASYSYGIQAFQDSTADIDMGAWSYTYNSLGELLAWEDANANAFSQTYDPLSRPLTRTEAEGTTTWTWGNDAGSHNIGSLAGVVMRDPGLALVYGESLAYDSVGRPSSRTISTDVSYVIGYAYNSLGALDTLTYPTSVGTPLKVKYGYANGILQSVTDWTSGEGTVYWMANAQNARGQTTQQTLGNAVVTNRSFDAVTGWLNSIQSGPSGGASLQNHSYAYDKVGNVTQRQESTLGLSENLYYDDLYRLTSSTLNGSTNLTVTYDAMGNITSKSGVGAYDYTTTQSGCSYYAHTQRHAVRSAGSKVYCYDANGNMTKRDGETITWSSYNFPVILNTAAESAVFSYGPDREYFKQVYTGPSVYEVTHYVGGILEKVYDGSSTDWRHYVHAEGQVVAVVSRTSSGEDVYYPLEDNQGSGSHLTSSGGTSLVRQSYDAFGWRRDGADWDGAEQAGDLAVMNGISRRGYTGHSMLGAMGLIHMNGRVHDAITGRFLSADPTIPDPGFTQSYNRYAYVYNNPLSYVDPSGYNPLDGSGGVPMPGTSACDRTRFSYPECTDFGFYNEMCRLGVSALCGDRSFEEILQTRQASAWLEAERYNYVRSIPDWALRPAGVPQFPGSSGPSRAQPPPVSVASSGIVAAQGQLQALDDPPGQSSVRNYVTEGLGWALIAFDIANTIVSPTPDAGIVGAGMVAGARAARAAREMTQWGWKGAKAWRDAAKLLGRGGTVEEIGGKIPTLKEALSLLKQVGATVKRIDGPHSAPNPHRYPHINFTTASGVSGTVRIIKP